MRCLRIYATPDGESRFGEVDLAMRMKPAFPNEAPLEISTYYPASRIRFPPHLEPGCAKWAFTLRRICSSPYGVKATWN